MHIREFIRLPHRFRWGGLTGDDCVMFCATWAAELCGTDPALAVRGTYRDAEGAHRIIKSRGGLVKMTGDGLEPLGFVRVDDVRDGDIGIIRAPAGIDAEITEIGGIRFGPLWAALAPSGVAGKRAEHVAAWRYVP